MKLKFEQFRSNFIYFFPYKCHFELMVLKHINESKKIFKNIIVRIRLYLNFHYFKEMPHIIFILDWKRKHFTQNPLESNEVVQCL